LNKFLYIKVNRLTLKMKIIHLINFLNNWIINLSTISMWLISLAFAVEGMWLPEDLPAQAGAMRDQGFTGDVGEWADLKRGPLSAVVSLGGCSASFVSAEGLIATNHHCVTGYLQQASREGEDLIDAGFLARARSDEPVEV
jgi:hypothetical protein